MPVYPPRIAWNGVTWQVKTSEVPVGPGPNLFDGSNVRVDSSGRLHLRIAKNASGQWTCAEIIGLSSYGYGTYAFTIASRVDTLDPNVVLGLFTWSDRAPYPNRELDIEFTKRGHAADGTNAQYVVQPYDRANHLRRFTQPADATSTHRFTWRKGQVSWESHGADAGLIDRYTYTGSDVPLAGDERVHLNVWLAGGAAPQNGAPAEVTLSSFAYAP